jgi:hypothetical protein
MSKVKPAKDHYVLHEVAETCRPPKWNDDDVFEESTDTGTAAVALAVQTSMTRMTTEPATGHYGNQSAMNSRFQPSVTRQAADANQAGSISHILTQTTWSQTMPAIKSLLSIALGVASITGTVALAGCATPVTRTTTTTEQVTTTHPIVAPMETTTTTETQQYHRQ